jgi:Cys-rich repeat protein
MKIVLLGFLLIGTSVFAAEQGQNADLGSMLRGGERPQASCIRSADCATGESCINGRCESNNGPGVCTSPVNCPVGETCRNGVCTPN